MSKVLISLEVPAIEEKYDLLIPDFLAVEECAVLLAKAVADMTQKRYVYSGKEVLLHRDKDGYRILNKKHTIADYRLKNGDALYIF